LGPWDKRVVMFAAGSLSFDEMQAWLSSVGANGDIADKAIADFLISSKASSGAFEGSKDN